MKRTTISIALAIAAVCGLMAFAGSAGAATATKVTIKHQSIGFFGFVKSDKQKCANGRKVTLYKMKGDNPKPRDDAKLGDDIAQPNGDGYMWSINTNAHRGDFYARAKAIPGCDQDISKVVSL